jgi:integral membrane protein (TIGR01906 family)
MLNKFLTALFGVAVFFFIITFSIALPIYCRFFYYLQIKPLGLPEATGYDIETIKSAYNQVLDFLTLPNREFGTGVFKYTESGKAHFYDCKVLFNLNLIVLIVSSVVGVTLFVLDKLKIITLSKPFKMNVSFISALSIFIFFALLAIVVAINFDVAFTVFHHIFFPGKNNWLFDPRYDQILRILPQDFFMNCAILIGASIILISLGIIVFQLIKRRKTTKKQEKSTNSLTNITK